MWISRVGHLLDGSRAFHNAFHILRFISLLARVARVPHAAIAGQVQVYLGCSAVICETQGSLRESRTPNTIGHPRGHLREPNKKTSLGSFRQPKKNRRKLA